MGTYYDSKVYFSPTAVPAAENPTLLEYEAVADWVEMDGLISAPAFGATDQYVSQDLINSTVAKSGKNVATAGAGDIVAEYNGLSTLQPQWAAAGQTSRNYMMKQELNDSPAPTETNTINYCYGLIGRQRKTEASAPGAFVNIIQPLQMNSDETSVPPTTI